MATWASCFEPIGAVRPGEGWIDLHSKSVVYNDHAFRVQRKGHAGIAEHVQTWKTANPDFKMKVTDVWPELKKDGKRRLTFEINGTGTFSGDLAAVLKPSNKAFGYQGRIDFTIDDKTGLIETIDEYYPFHFDSGKSIEDYRKVEKDNN